MIELFEQNERKADRQSSKGNQLKWENNGIWYKADCTGYEGLAEYMISHLLKFSSLQKDEFVLYDYERIKYKNIFYNGVKSNNFLYDDWQIITLERLFHNFFHGFFTALYIIQDMGRAVKCFFLTNYILKYNSALQSCLPDGTY